jgi:hypothetical protein
MSSIQSISMARLCAGGCLVWAVLLAHCAVAQEESLAIYPGLTTEAPSPPPGWKASMKQWTPVSKAGYEQTPMLKETTGELAPTYPQIKNPLKSPRLEKPMPVIHDPNEIIAPPLDTCPDCGEPLNSAECRQGERPRDKLFHVFDLHRWLFIDAEQRAQREPWLHRPFSIGLFMGPISGSPLIRDSITQGTGSFAGARFGYDLDDDWGLEMRIASASMPLYGGFALGAQNDSDHFVWDIDFLYYFWGDAAYRPYFLMGIGTSRIKFVDQNLNAQSRILAGMPFGVGMKWKLSEWFIFRAECLDNVAFAGGSVFQTQHNFSFTAGFEIRFGQPHLQYWPWDPSTRL